MVEFRPAFHLHAMRHPIKISLSLREEEKMMVENTKLSHLNFKNVHQHKLYTLYVLYIIHSGRILKLYAPEKIIII